MTGKLRQLTSAARNVQQIVAAIVGAAFTAAVVRVLLEWASRIHVVVAALLAFGVVAAAVWLTRLVRSSRHATDATGVISVLSLSLLSVAIVGAWLSYTLHVNQFADYSVPDAFSAGTFVDLYMYTFVDLIPAIDAWETLHVNPPIQALDALAGVPILAFKIYVAWLMFDALLAWLKRRNHARAVIHEQAA